MQESGIKGSEATRRIHIGNTPNGGTEIHCIFEGGPCEGFPKECDICPGWAGWGLEIKEVRVCRACGCTDDWACEGGCSWVEDPEGLGDLCSQCLPKLVTEAIHFRDKLQRWGGKIIEFLDSFEGSFEEDELTSEALDLQEEGLNLGLQRIYPSRKEEES